MVKKQQEISLFELKQRLIKIATKIDEYCDKNHLDYYMIGGTLLGAVRHKGFIPWDDDLDIAMPREDYEKFISNFKDDSGIYKVISYKNSKGYPYQFAKVIDASTILIEKNINEKEMGVYVDIFPIDMMDGNFEKIRKLLYATDFYRFILGIKYTKKFNDKNIIKRYAKYIIKAILSIIQIKSIQKKLDTLAQSRNVNREESIYCGVMTVMTYREGEIFQTNAFEDYVVLDFEGIKLRAPLKYHIVLEQLYGDYMKIPSKDKRVSHHKFKAYLKEK